MSEPKTEPEGKEPESVEDAEKTVQKKPASLEEKPEKRRKKEKAIFKQYGIEKDRLTRQRPFCERCGPGFFMADHGNRFSCGNCGFTRYKQIQT